MPAVVPWIAHLDVDAFFAAIEQRDDPALRGRPVAVGTGVVASCSPEAKRRHYPGDGRLIDPTTFTRPDPGVVRVLPGREADYLAPWSVRVLHGLGPKMEERLDRVNVHLVGELAALPMHVACAMLGHRA